MWISVRRSIAQKLILLSKAFKITVIDKLKDLIEKEENGYTYA